MKTTPALPVSETTPKMSVEAARMLLDQALEAANTERDKAAESAHKRAINAHTGASVFLPPEIIITPATAAPEPDTGS